MHLKYCGLSRDISLECPRKQGKFFQEFVPEIAAFALTISRNIKWLYFYLLGFSHLSNVAVNMPDHSGNSSGILSELFNLNFGKLLRVVCPVCARSSFNSASKSFPKSSLVSLIFSSIFTASDEFSRIFCVSVFTVASLVLSSLYFHSQLMNINFLC